ncbi:hypothetical protein BCD67_19680 [Oscillatoriales cyanobacterium USR001]|nr:hypothetical protein BCD67_19680 [Oscillatoriales cyanobacterium USR001]
MTVSLPLLKLFNRLREHLPLGVDQYNLALEALIQSIEDDFDPTDIEAVKRLCQIVWVKSPEQKKIFDNIWQDFRSVSATQSKLIRENLQIDKDGEKPPEINAIEPLLDDDQPRDNDGQIPENYVNLETAETQVGRAASVFWKEAYYFPVSRQQLWDGCQKFQPEKLPKTRREIDIIATVEQVAKAGFFTNPIFAQNLTIENPPEVLLLIDQQGSMTPFHPFCRHLVKIWGNTTKIKIYYFQNCPKDVLYLDPQLRQETEDLETLLEKLPTDNTIAMIISDGGAAKGRTVISRWEETVEFLNILTDEVQRVAWLNPLPRCRWFDSTAKNIADIYPKEVPMFALESWEWEKMIQWLRWGEKSVFQFIQQRQEAAKEKWQPTDSEDDWDWNFDAKSLINNFEKKYTQAHLQLAFHAAFPLTITPDLLYRLWQEFLVKDDSQKNLPWYAVADILLSDLCKSIDTELTELYEIDREIRNELLSQCVASFGEKRLEALSNFLIKYLDEQIQKPPSWLETLYEMQHWAALAYTNRKDEAAENIAKSLQQAYLHNHKSQLIQWSELVTTLTPVLSDKKYRPLLVAAEGYGAEARGIKRVTQATRQKWEGVFGKEEIASVGKIALAKPGSILGRFPLKSFTFETVTVNPKGEIIQRETKQSQYLTENIGKPPLEMVYIPGGNFTMGSPEGEGYRFEKPQHQVTIKPFLMGKHPVTQAQWEAVANLPKIQDDLDPNPSRFKGKNRPVERVSWHNIIEFCARLSQKTGKNYRLPSEAEWEYACRAGTTTPFHFGETITPDLANYDGNYTYKEGPKGIYRQETTPVGSFQVANAFGIYDMHGNVWEWCADPWHDNYEGSPTDGSVWDENNNDNHYQSYIDLLVNIRNDNRPRLLRGGSWYDSADNCRAAYRYLNSPDYRLNSIGFRVVCSGAWLP